MTALAGRSTRARLLAAARELVEEQGYAGASVLAIAERAGVASGTLYRHFASKQELFVELFRSVCDGEITAMERAALELPPTTPATDRLVGVLSAFARRALRSRTLAWALLAEPVDPLVDAERLIYRRRYATLLANLLDHAIAAGELPAQDVCFTAAALVGGCAEALIGPLSPSATPAVEAVTASIGAFVRRAVGATQMSVEAER